MNGCSIPRWAVAVAVGSVLVLAWHAAIDGALIVPAPPDPVPGDTPDATLAAFFAWLRGIAVHDLGVRALAAVTFLALAGLGRSLSAIDPDDGPGTAAWRSGMAIGWAPPRRRGPVRCPWAARRARRSPGRDRGFRVDGARDHGRD